jgi:hypothetical protein
MKINLVKYVASSESAVVVSDAEPTSIVLIDCNDNMFSLNDWESLQTSNGIVTTLSLSVDNLIYNGEEDTYELNLNGLFTIRFVANSTYAIYPVYDSSMFLDTKIDMMNAIKDRDSKGDMYKYLVKFSFLESGLFDCANLGADIDVCRLFYSDMIMVKNSFETYYRYGNRL